MSSAYRYLNNLKNIIMGQKSKQQIIKHWLGGEYYQASGPIFQTINPDTEEYLYIFNQVNDQEIDQAVNFSTDGQESWADTELTARTEIVRNFCQILTDNIDLFAATISKETGKIISESEMEVKSAAAKGEIAIAAHKERIQSKSWAVSGVEHILEYKPYGIMLVIGPFNFPLHLPNGHIMPALLAGNSVIFKPSEISPATGSLMTAAWLDAGLPPSVLTMINGNGVTANKLVCHPAINGVLFTGGVKAGKSIMQSLVDRPGKIVALEMGGNNPLIIHNSDDIERSCDLIIESAFRTTGQRCTCARRLIITGHQEQLIDRLISKAKEIQLSEPFANIPNSIGPLAVAKSRAEMLEMQTKLINNGATALLKAVSPTNKGYYISPAIIDVTNCNAIEDDEIFGPLLQIIRTETLKEAINIANNTKFGLATGLIGGNSKDFKLVKKYAKAGIINWNRPLTGASSKLPFGGIGDSGNNRPQGYFSCDYTVYPVATLAESNLKSRSKVGGDR